MNLVKTNLKKGPKLKKKLYFARFSGKTGSWTKNIDLWQKVKQPYNSTFLYLQFDSKSYNFYGQITRDHHIGD